MTIKIIDLVESTKKEIKNQEDFIEALKELKVINGLTHRQHAKINKILKDNNLDKKYSFEFKKAEAYVTGSAYVQNLENNQTYFCATSSTYGEIVITDETINEANKKLKVLNKAHAFALENEAEIRKQHELIEDSKKKIIEAIKYNKEIASEFYEKFTFNNVSSIYVNEDSNLTISIY